MKDKASFHNNTVILKSRVEELNQMVKCLDMNEDESYNEYVLIAINQLTRMVKAQSDRMIRKCKGSVENGELYK
ncbi:MULTISPECIES: hypothetical protein [unclassified Clostridium]|uniref:hypothetical protein n=1 Tax=unclassified Clostridium TaxID=2614128 RepID=UPI0025BABD88|nr:MULTISPECIES: hypothetical protein [unclassified Clostridium]